MARSFLLVFALASWSGHRHSASACSCDVRLYQPSGFGNRACSRPGVDFGCYTDEDSMWIRPPCGSIFRCNADDRDVGHNASRQRGAPLRCGSRWFRPAPGQTRLNCSCCDGANGGTDCAPPERRKAKHFHERRSRTCGERASVDPMGGVSAAFRRLPQQAGTNPAVRCCRNSANGNGTLSFTQRNYATWPRACEALCDAHPSGRCHYFSHSFRNFVCLHPVRVLPARNPARRRHLCLVPAGHRGTDDPLRCWGAGAKVNLPHRNRNPKKRATPSSSFGRRPSAVWRRTPGALRG